MGFGIFRRGLAKFGARAIFFYAHYVSAAAYGTSQRRQPPIAVGENRSSIFHMVTLRLRCARQSRKAVRPTV